MKYFGRSEQGKHSILWSVYEAEKEDDYTNGRLVASFDRHKDAVEYIKMKEEYDKMHIALERIAGAGCFPNCSLCEAKERYAVAIVGRPKPQGMCVTLGPG